MRFPDELTALRQWICWRLEPDPKGVAGTPGGKDRKVPYDPKTNQRASSTNPATWATLDEAKTAHARYLYSGLGFVFTKEGGIVGVDIDHCRDPETGALNETATVIMAKLPPTFAEVSPSGTGLHLFLRGILPGAGNKNAKSGVEMYAHARYFTMTGDRLPGAPDIIADAGDALRWIHETYIRPPRKQRAKRSVPGAPGAALSDDALLAKARAARNHEDFDALWAGEWQGNYGSQSEADLALCGMFAFWSGKSKEQMDRLFRQSGLMRPKWDVVHHTDGAEGATYGEGTLERAIETTEDVYSPDGDAPIFEDGGRYFRAKGDSVYPITNFVFKPIEMIVADDETQMTADLVTVRGEVFRETIMTTDFNNLAKWKNVLNKHTIALSYTGSEGDLELLKGFVAGLPWTVKRGVKALGVYEHGGSWAFVSSSGAIRAGGEPVHDLVQLERHRSIDTAIQGRAPIDAAALAELCPLLLRYNEPAKTVPVLAWCAGCFLKEHLRAAHIKFPHLFLVGEAGSGKSNTLERVILPVFSRTKVNAATQVTAFTLMKDSASSNVIPQALDEFKPSKIDRIRLNALYNHFRDAYDGHEGVRGRADQTSVSYALLAPLIVAGEESPDEAAIRERSMELLFSKRDIKEPSARAAFKRLGGLTDALGAFGRGLLDVALSTPTEAAIKWHAEALPLFSAALPTRVVNNLACCMAGLRLVEALCARLGLMWGQAFDIGMNACADHLQYAAREYLLDGGEANKSVVEQTLEVMDRMGFDEEEWRVLEDGRQVAVHFRSVYDRYTKYRRDHAIVGECLTYSQFMRQLRKSDLFMDAKLVRFRNDVKRAIILDYDTLKQRCEVSGFSGTEAVPLNTESAL